MQMVSSTLMNILVSVFLFKCVCLYLKETGKDRNQLFSVSYIDFVSLFPLSVCFSGDMYSQNGDANEPEWVKTEREQFTEFRDQNKDGRMDKDETRDWILPSDYDHAEAEAKHLLYESDADQVKAW